VPGIKPRGKPSISTENGVDSCSKSQELSRARYRRTAGWPALLNSSLSGLEVEAEHGGSGLLALPRLANTGIIQFRSQLSVCLCSTRRSFSAITLAPLPCPATSARATRETMPLLQTEKPHRSQQAPEAGNRPILPNPVIPHDSPR
jgi:hypothetical protein